MLPLLLDIREYYMNIIGAGLTGCLAAYAFKNAVIHEYLEKPNVHKAVLRFRSDAVSNLTGIPFKQVTVYKGVYMNGEFVNPDIRMMNMYSRKVTGGYSDRSITNLDPVVRYIAPIDFHDRMLAVLADRINYGSSVQLVDMKRPVISTLPLPVVLTMLNKGTDHFSGNKLDSRPIHVLNMKIPNADIYQTIYYPDIKSSVYRASMTGDQLIVESVSPVSGIVLDGVLKSFGFRVDIGSDPVCTVQQFGKFIPLDSDYRKDLMYTLTSEENIYSLGRHATWRKILLDDVVQDLQRIESMIKTSAYDRLLGRMK